MTKHTFIRILFSITFSCLLALVLFYHCTIAWFCPLVLLYIATIAIGSYFIEVNFFIFSYCRGNRSKSKIAITFDDGPHILFTPQILDILKSNSIPATFFVIGQNLKDKEAIIKRIDQEGHLIGNHSFKHSFWFPLQSASQIAHEIKQTQDIINYIIGKKMMLFRPPFGVTNPNVAKAIQTTEMKSIGWSLRSYDTVTLSPTALLHRLTKNLKNGDIVLFHDHCEATIAILPDFIKYVCGQGIEIVALDKLIEIDAYKK